MNTTLTKLTETTSNALINVTLNNVNAARLALVSDEMRETTETIMKTMQFSSGVSIAFCAMLYEVKCNEAMLKASPQKNFSTYCEQILRTDKSQASNYCKMYEVLFVDIDKPFKTVNVDTVNDYTVAQLVAMTKVKDRTVRTLFINEYITPDFSCTNINKAVKYLNNFNRNTIDKINWNDVIELLENGGLKSNEVETTATEKTETATENTPTENTTTETATENSNSCKFTTVEEFTRWLKKNKDITITDITITYTK